MDWATALSYPLLPLSISFLCPSSSPLLSYPFSPHSLSPLPPPLLFSLSSTSFCSLSLLFSHIPSLLSVTILVRVLDNRDCFWSVCVCAYFLGYLEQKQPFVMSLVRVVTGEGCYIYICKYMHINRTKSFEPR